MKHRESYHWLLIPRNIHMLGHSGGAFVYLSQFPELQYTERYYLPLVGVVDPKNPIALAHELMHLSDLMQWLEEDPSYAARALRMSSYEQDNDADLEERIDFDLHKILYLEQRAFQLEYRKRVRHINLPLGPIERINLPCYSEQEFVQIWLSQYIRSVYESYNSRFPIHITRIEAAFRRATNSHGRESFGDHPYEAVLHLQDQLLSL